MQFNGVCNTTLEDMRIGSSELPVVGTMTFHTLGAIVGAACALFAIMTSLYLIWMHAMHYTKPYEQRHIIRILFMVPIYSTAAFLSYWFYWHAIYFQVLSDCYEAFAIASFFALLCHYIAPDLHEQKNYFRSIEPMQWVWPLNWFQSCCASTWRTPRSGLTWFNIIWTGIYQYCFIRVAMTVTAVLTQYFGKYCESSNSPIFAHIWILVIEGTAVSIAMYCVIQFYVQLRTDVASHRPFLKVLAIKLVIFLSFWQSFLISILTSATFNVVKPNAKIAYPDLKVGVPSLLLCIEMAIFSILHLFAFPYKPYSQRLASSYPLSPGLKSNLGPKLGGPLGVMAIADAMNPWDLFKGFARGMRWLVIGLKHREKDMSYKTGSLDASNSNNNISLEPQSSSPEGYKRSENLPIADEFRHSKFCTKALQEGGENAGLIAYAQPNPLNHPGGYTSARQRYDLNGQEIAPVSNDYDAYALSPPGTQRREESSVQNEQIGVAAMGPPELYPSHAIEEPYTSSNVSQAYFAGKRMARQEDGAPPPSQQWASAHSATAHHDAVDSARIRVHNALWRQGQT